MPLPVRCSYLTYNSERSFLHLLIGARSAEASVIWARTRFLLHSEGPESRLNFKPRSCVPLYLPPASVSSVYVAEREHLVHEFPSDITWWKTDRVQITLCFTHSPGFCVSIQTYEATPAGSKYIVM